MSDAELDPAATARLLRRRAETGTIELRVSGSSMSEVIESGSTVVVEAAPVPRPGEIWVFTDDEGVIVVHRVRHVDEFHVIGRGTGNHVDDGPVPIENAVGRVRALTRPDGSPKRFGIIDRRAAQVSFKIRQMAVRVRRGRR